MKFFKSKKKKGTSNKKVSRQPNVETRSEQSGSYEGSDDPPPPPVPVQQVEMTPYSDKSKRSAKRSSSRKSPSSSGGKSSRSGSHDKPRSSSQEKPRSGSQEKPRSGSQEKPRSGSHGNGHKSKSSGDRTHGSPEGSKGNRQSRRKSRSASKEQKDADSVPPPADHGDRPRIEDPPPQWDAQQGLPPQQWGDQQGMQVADNANVAQQQQQQYVDASNPRSSYKMPEMEEMEYGMMSFEEEMKYYGRSSVGNTVAQRFASFKRSLSYNFKNDSDIVRLQKKNQRKHSAVSGNPRYTDKKFIQRELVRFYRKHNVEKSKRDIQFITKWVAADSGHLKTLNERLFEKYNDRLKL